MSLDAFVFVSGPVFTSGESSLSSPNAASGLLYVHALILDWPVPMPARSVLFITSPTLNGI